MKIIEAGYEIHKLSSWEDMMKHIEAIGRTCYKSNDLITADSHLKFIRGLIDRGHNAMIEHVGFSVCFTVDRGVSHEAVRHRLASFAQESTRYCNYEKEKFGGQIKYISVVDTFKEHPVMQKLSPEAVGQIIGEWYEACADAECHYKNMIQLGCPAELARTVLNHSTATTLWVTMNIREWRHFFSLRACDATGKAHPQIKEVAVPLLKQLREECPTFFGDLKLKDEL